jgi:hypothetical protein
MIMRNKFSRSADRALFQRFMKQHSSPASKSTAFFNQSFEALAQRLRVSTCMSLPKTAAHPPG